MTRLSFVTFDAPLGIGDRLCAIAVTRSGGASWLFPTPDNRRRLSPAAVGFDHHDGLAWIAVFPVALSVRTGEARFRQMAEAALSEAVTMHLAMPRERVLIGAFDGSGGLAWALAMVGRWLDQDVLNRQALKVLRRPALTRPAIRRWI
jgi:lantibiotic modifying enzyme